MQHRLPQVRLALIGMLLVCLVPGLAAQVHATPGQIDFIIRLKGNRTAQTIATSHQLLLTGVAGEYARLTLNDPNLQNAKLDELSHDQGVSYVELNYENQFGQARQRSSWAVGLADPQTIGNYQNQWALSTIRLASAQQVTNGAGVTVAILDTGVDATHPALAGHLVAGFDAVDNDPDPSEVMPATGQGMYGHGTHVAGLVALVAPGAAIMPIRTLNPEGTGTVWDQIVGIQYAIDHGAGVINLSWSFTTRSKALEDVLADATCKSTNRPVCTGSQAAGAVIISAAGNSSNNLAEYPAAANFPALLAVTSSTASNTLSTFANYGAWVNIAAPGEQIVSTVPGGGYQSWSGTSMATPLVAGTAALVRAANPSMKPNNVVNRIKTQSARLDSNVRRNLDAGAAVTN